MDAPAEPQRKVKFNLSDDRQLFRPNSPVDSIASATVEAEEIELTDEKTLDPELVSLFQSLVNAQEDYRLLLEMDPKNPASESKDKIRQILERFDAEILISQFNLHEMKKRRLKSIYGMTRAQVIETLDYATARRDQLLQYIATEIPRSTPIVGLGFPATPERRKCICCTCSESDFNPFYQSDSGLVCRDCFRVFHPDRRLPSPKIARIINPEASIPSAADQIKCTLCKKHGGELKVYQSIFLCRDCHEIVEEKPKKTTDNSDYLCPNCFSDGTYRILGENKHYCSECRIDFISKTSSQIKTAPTRPCPSCQTPLTWNENPQTRAIYSYYCGKCVKAFTGKEETIVKPKEKMVCTICQSDDLIQLKNTGEYFCKGVCGRIFKSRRSSPLIKECPQCHSKELTVDSTVTPRKDEVSRLIIKCSQCLHSLHLPLTFKCENCQSAQSSYKLINGKYLCEKCQIIP